MNLLQKQCKVNHSVTQSQFLEQLVVWLSVANVSDLCRSYSLQALLLQYKGNINAIALGFEIRYPFYTSDGRIKSQM